MSYKTENPIIFCIYNRPEATKRVFETIRLACPPALYVIADGPRAENAGEKELCDATRKITKDVNWPCEVTYDFSDTNLGCRDRIYSGISNAFNKFDFAIILEDDCLPSPDFFRFIDTIRRQYDNDTSVMHISGTTFVRPHNPKQDYYRSNLPTIWGWATWKRSWADLDLDISSWPKLEKRLISELYGSSRSITRFIRRLSKSYKHTKYDGYISSWSYPYIAHVLESKGHCITPLNNLVANIGFGSSATHTRNSSSPQASIPLDRLPIKIRHIEQSEIDESYSAIQLDNTLYRPRKIKRTAYNICNKLGLHILPKLRRPNR